MRKVFHKVISICGHKSERGQYVIANMKGIAEDDALPDRGLCEMTGSMEHPKHHAERLVRMANTNVLED
jgi:hypothetical protein